MGVTEAKRASCDAVDKKSFTFLQTGFPQLKREIIKPQNLLRGIDGICYHMQSTSHS